jgi:hypothetical protein
MAQRQNEPAFLTFLGIKGSPLMAILPSLTTQSMSNRRVLTETERRKELGDWGEVKALELLRRPGSSFKNARDVNQETHNHPFGDIYAERDRRRLLLGVKTRNMYQVSGKLNGEYNIRKKGADVLSIARRYNADLGWVAIQVIPERQTFNAYFGTIAEIEESKERFSIPMMKPDKTARYVRLGQENEFDSSIRPEWSNGGYSAMMRKRR